MRWVLFLAVLLVIPVVTAFSEPPVCSDWPNFCDGKTDGDYGVAQCIGLTCTSDSCTSVNDARPYCDTGGTGVCCGWSSDRPDCGLNGCTDFQTDRNNCGSAGNNCENWEDCCGGVCTDIFYDSDNCGSCGNTITDQSRYECCDGEVTDKLWDYLDDEENCGGCANKWSMDNFGSPGETSYNPHICLEYHRQSCQLGNCGCDSDQLNCDIYYVIGIASITDSLYEEILCVDRQPQCNVGAGCYDEEGKGYSGTGNMDAQNCVMDDDPWELRCTEIWTGYSPSGSYCTDNNLCTSPDACDGVGNCEPGSAVSCSTSDDYCLTDTRVRDYTGGYCHWSSGCRDPYVDRNCPPSEVCIVDQCVPCDQDGDGYSAIGSPTLCPVPRTDCDDTDPNINPGVAEICTDAIDNDCDLEIDYDGVSGNTKGDSECKVDIQGISTVTTNKCSLINPEVDILCDANVGNVRSLSAELNGIDCTKREWSGTVQRFTCPTPADGAYRPECNINLSQSYSDLSTMDAPLGVNCYVSMEGRVTDIVTGQPIQSATVRELFFGKTDSSDTFGQYRINDIHVGSISAIADHSMYLPQTHENIVLTESTDPYVQNFELSPEECTPTCSIYGVCNYDTCLGVNGCTLDGFRPEHQLEVIRICDDADAGTVFNLNSTHKVECCSGNPILAETVETELEIESCAEDLITQTRLVEYNGKIIQLVVMSFNQC